MENFSSHLLEVTEKTETAMKENRQVSVSRTLKSILGFSRFGYCAVQKHMPSDAHIRMKIIKATFLDIYDETNL